MNLFLYHKEVLYCTSFLRNKKELRKLNKFIKSMKAGISLIYLAKYKLQKPGWFFLMQAPPVVNSQRSGSPERDSSHPPQSLDLTVKMGEEQIPSKSQTGSLERERLKSRSHVLNWDLKHRAVLPHRIIELEVLKMSLSSTAELRTVCGCIR